MWSLLFLIDFDVDKIFFFTGHCEFGTRCHFSHLTPEQKQELEQKGNKIKVEWNIPDKSEKHTKWS